MPKMTPFQIIVTSVFAVIALGSLFFFATFKGFGGSKPAGNVVIWGTLAGSAVQAGIDDLRRTHQEFNGVTYVQKDESTFEATLADALASGTGPDAIIMTQESLMAERSKLAVIPFATIPQRTYQDTYLPVYSLFLTSGGTYGVPLAVDPLVLYYNRTTLASHNVAQVPATWEGVLGLAPSLTQKTDAGQIQKSAIALGTYENVDHARDIISLLLLQSGSPIVEVSSAGIRSVLSGAGKTNASGVNPAVSAINFYTQFADPAKTVYTWSRALPDSRQAFISGDAAMYVGFASERSFIAAANPNLDFDMAPIPQPQTASSKSDYGHAYVFALTKGSRNPSGTTRSILALAGTTETPFITSPLGIAPAARSLLSAPASDPYLPIVYSSALIVRGWLSPAPAVTDRIFAAMITSIVSGSGTALDALSTADQSLTAALK